MLKVDNEYYELVAEDYVKQITKIENSLETFKLLCDTLYDSNNFGTFLQEIMREIYVNFYESSKEKLSILWGQAKSIQEIFTSNVIEHDKM